MVVKFNYIEKFKVNQVLKLRSFIGEIFYAEGKKLQLLNYIFCNDDYLLEINKEFLNHDELTDIITFDLSDGNGIIGEIYISVTRVKENALNLGLSYYEELNRVIFHGALHLVGYKDKTKREIIEMRSKEEHYLRLFEQKKHGS